MKYILIFTTEDDVSSQRVIDWFYFYNITPIIINTSNLVSFVDSVTISCKEQSGTFKL
jgi:hypothetical protein